MVEKSFESTSTAGSDINHANIGRIHQEIREFQSQQGSSSGVGKVSSGDSPASRTVERDGKNVTHLNFAGDDIFSSKLDGTQKTGTPGEKGQTQFAPPPESQSAAKHHNNHGHDSPERSATPGGDQAQKQTSSDHPATPPNDQAQKTQPEHPATPPNDQAQQTQAGEHPATPPNDQSQKTAPPEHPATPPSTDRSQSTPPPERFAGSQADGAKEKSGIDNSTKAPKPGEPAQPETTGAKGHGNHPSHAGKSAEQSGPAEPKNDSPPPAAGGVGAPKGDAQPASPADRMLTPQPDGQVKPTDKTAERLPQAQESQSVGSAESTTHKHATTDTAHKHHSEKQAPATVPPAAPPPPAAKPTE